MKTSERIYQRLSKATDYMSGQKLADDLGVTRAAVWKAIKQLEEKGIQIASHQQKGYRLLSGDIILVEELAKELDFPVHFRPTSRSTQLDAKEGMENGLTSPALYLAGHQTAAKGRFGRSFFASPQGGIYMSLHIEPNLPADQLPPYTLMVAASIVKAISRLTGISTDIKWVNDIYLNQKKIAGILTEAISSVETGLVTHVIIGVGINFFIDQFPDEIKNKVGSLFHQEPPISRQELIASIWQLFFQTPPQDLYKIYQDHSMVLERQVSFQEKGQLLSGKAIAIGPQGQLIVQLPDGTKKRLNSGEISLSSW